MILSLSNGMLHMYIIHATFIENGIFLISNFIKYVCHIKFLNLVNIYQLNQYQPKPSLHCGTEAES